MDASRIACVNLPHVAVALEERDHRELVDRPLAIESPQPGPRVVYDLSHVARQAGVVRGMSLSQARKVCPDLTVLPARLDAYRDTFRLLLEVLGQFTPRVEPAGLENSWLATRGLTPDRRALPWAGPGPTPERSLAADLVREVRRQVGLPARVGLAHGKLTSRIVARHLAQRDTMVLPPGKERAFRSRRTTSSESGCWA
jgi:DNA polymerase-4